MTAINFNGKLDPTHKITDSPQLESDDTSLADADGLDRNLRSSNRTQDASFQELRHIELQVADLSQNAGDPLQGLLSNHLLTEDE
jgi:hypothetical protein